MDTIKNRGNVIPKAQGDFQNCNSQKCKKECAGRCSSNPGIHLLEIRFVEKSGFFCDSCRDDLVNHDLIKFEFHNTDSGEYERCSNTSGNEKENASEVLKSSLPNERTASNGQPSQV